MLLLLPACLPTQICRHQPALHVRSYILWTCHNPTTGSEKAMQYSLITHLSDLLTTSRSTAYKYPTNLVQSWLPGISVSSPDLGLQVYLLTHLITACKFTQSWFSSASPNWFNHSLHAPFQSCSITADKSISHFTHFKLPSRSPNTLYRGVQVCTFIASKWIWTFTGSQTSDTSWYALNHHLLPVQIYHV